MIWKHCHSFPENISLVSRCHILMTWSLLWLALGSFCGASPCAVKVSSWGKKGNNPRLGKLRQKVSFQPARSQSKAIPASFPDKRSCGIPPRINFSTHTFCSLFDLASKQRQSLRHLETKRPAVVKAQGNRLEPGHVGWNSAREPIDGLLYWIIGH